MKEDLYRTLKSGNRLPSAPGVALRLLDLCRDDETSVKQLADTISSDPALAGRILRFVNSPMSGISRKVSSLRQAVTLIGLRGVKTISLSFSLVSSGHQSQCSRFDFEAFWGRSLAIAVSARVLAKHTNAYDPEEAFMAGLLTRIGQLALACCIPDRYDDVLIEANQSGGEVIEIEGQLLGITHAEIGCDLLTDWRLPETIAEATGHACRAVASHGAGGQAPLVQILYGADLAATIICDPCGSNAQYVDEILAAVNTQWAIDAETWHQIFEQITAHWKEYGALLTIHTGDVRSFAEILDEARNQMAELTLAMQFENQTVLEQNQELLKESRTDRLTGVANRAAFDEQIAVELERARRTQRPLMLLLGDVDKFKSFNDIYGHQAGDAVLQGVARALDHVSRKIDVVARFGGEEFAIIAPECAPEGATALAERFRKAVEQARFEWQGQRLRVTISFGGALAQWPGRPMTVEELTAAADMQLYAVKAAGRNGCRVDAGAKPMLAVSSPH